MWHYLDETAYCHRQGHDVTVVNVIGSLCLFIAGFSCKNASLLNNNRTGSEISGMCGSTGTTFAAVILCLDRFKPTTFILENVKGLLQQWEDVRTKLCRVGYLVHHIILNPLSPQYH